jgi:hypothetical protein
MPYRQPRRALEANYSKGPLLAGIFGRLCGLVGAGIGEASRGSRRVHEHGLD